MSTTHSSDRLIVTNGDSAMGAIRAAGIADDIVPWRDVLHDGPVPAGLDAPALATVRARFIAARGWADETTVLADFNRRDARLEAARSGAEIVIWLEHDLYDQLQLLQVMARLASRPLNARLTLAGGRAFVAEQTSETLVAHFAARLPVTAEQIAIAHHGWEAFRAPTPEALVELAVASQMPDAPLPFLGAALARLLEEYPAIRGGLSRTQRRILEAVVAGAAQVEKLFAAVGATEEARFMGDWSFWMILDGLLDATKPALAMVGGLPFRWLAQAASAAAFRAQEVRLTAFGHALLDDLLLDRRGTGQGAETGDWVEANGIDLWLGGVHLTGDAVWRWDAENERLVKP